MKTKSRKIIIAIVFVTIGIIFLFPPTRMLLSIGRNALFYRLAKKFNYYPFCKLVKPVGDVWESGTAKCNSEVLQQNIGK